MVANRTGRAGQPAGPHCRRCDRRARLHVSAARRAPRSARSSRLPIAQTGATEKLLTQLGETDFEKIYIFPNSHAGYYPGAKYLATKVIFRKSDGRLLGAQVLGEDGVAKRIDSFAMAVQMGCTIYDLEEAELSYAPPFGSAKDPVNFAGMVAADVLRGDMPICHWDMYGNGFLLDVRNPAELAVESVPGAVNIPLPQLRARLSELPRDRESWSSAGPPQRAYTPRGSYY